MPLPWATRYVGPFTCALPSGYARPRAQAVVIEVADEGDGIRPEIIEKVFEPFLTTKFRGQGTGLGLAQVRAFATASGGDVQIRSEVNRGTTVTMMFPAMRASGASDHAEGAATTPRMMLEGKLLLPVEDNAHVRDDSHQLSSAEGLAVRVVNDAQGARSLLSQGFSADFLVSDCLMPGEMGGVHLVGQVKLRFPHARAGVVTGFRDIAGRAREEGFTLLGKPYDLPAPMGAES